MTLMRFPVALLWVFVFTASSQAQKAKIKNLQVTMHEPTKTVRIAYDLVGNTKATVVKLAIFRADSSLVISPTLRGVKEAALSPHHNKIIYWDVLEDNIYTHEKFRFELTAEESGNVFKPGFHWTVRGAGIGGLAGSWIIWNKYQMKLSQLNSLSPIVDPDGDGIIQDAVLYEQWRNQYSQVRQTANGKYFYVCLGMVAVAAVFDIYMVLHDAEIHRKAISFGPSTSGLGIGLYYRFATKNCPRFR